MMAKNRMRFVHVVIVEILSMNDVQLQNAQRHLLPKVFAIRITMFYTNMELTQINLMKP